MRHGRYKAILLDFYGTLVEEDDRVIEEILRAIAASSPVSSDLKRIARDWRFQELCADSCGGRYRSQRDVEVESLIQLCMKYRVDINIKEFTEKLFNYWCSPIKFNEADAFVQSLKLHSYPACIVSNIDREDLGAALLHCGWDFKFRVTSEDCRSYKPRPEMFRCALDLLKVSPDEALHIGDSLRSDVVGAQRLGVDTVWVNRKGRTVPLEVEPPTYTVTHLEELCLLMED